MQERKNIGSTVPPHSNDSEVAVLGGILQNCELMPDIIEILPDSKAFYSEIHQVIYKTLIDSYNAGNKTDLVILSDILHKQKKLEFVGGSYYLSELISKAKPNDLCRQYAFIVKEYFIKRDIIRQAQKIIENGYDPSSDALNLLSDAENSIRELAIEREVKSIKTPYVLAREVYDKIASIVNGENDKVVYSYIADLDSFTLGFHGSELIIMAARPRMGKTALALTMLYNNSIVRDIPTAILSLEMSDYELWVRLATMATNIPNSKFRKGTFSQDEINKVTDFINQYANSRLYIDNLSRLSSIELRSKASKYVKQYGIKLLVIDYLQLMTGKSKENRNLELAEISRTCKEIAKEYDIPVIALSQLNRDFEKRGKSRKPQLSDLRDSGAIEADADMILFLDRPEEDGIKKFDDGTSTENMAVVKLGKHRHGESGECVMGFYKHRTMFVGMDLWHKQPKYEQPF
jgi:replicative DNA helicase